MTQMSRQPGGQQWCIMRTALQGDYITPPYLVDSCVGERASAFRVLYETACAEGEKRTKGKRGWTLLRKGDDLYLYYEGWGSGSAILFELMEVVDQVRTHDLTPGTAPARS